MEYVVSRGLFVFESETDVKITIRKRSRVCLRTQCLKIILKASSRYKFTSMFPVDVFFFWSFYKIFFRYSHSELCFSVLYFSNSQGNYKIVWVHCNILAALNFESISIFESKYDTFSSSWKEEMLQTKKQQQMFFYVF